MISDKTFSCGIYSSKALDAKLDCILFLSGLVEHTVNPQLHCYIAKREETSDQRGKKKFLRMLGAKKKKKANLSVTVHFTCRGS